MVGVERHVVVKVGGAAVGVGGNLPPALDDVVTLVREGWRVTVVHGGGPEISRWSERLGKTARFVAGLRYSDADTVAVAEMALARVGKAIAAGLSAAGVPAVSLGGQDGGLLRAERLRLRDEQGQELDLGLVGRLSEVATGILDALHSAGLVAVLAPVAPDASGQLLNVNADDAAAEVAAAVGAEALVLASDVPGVLVPGRAEPLGSLDAERVRALVRDGVVSGGMRPKVEACLRATEHGVTRAWIVDGRRPGTVRDAAHDRPGAGTAVRGSAPAALAAEREAVLTAYQDLFMPTYSRAPAVLIRGRGSWVWDLDGTSYLDFLCGISVNNLGHCHPAVVQAVARQSRILAHTSNLYHTLPQLETAQELMRLGFAGRVFFANSGAEATEGAIKLCRKAAWRRAQERGEPQRLEIVSFEHSFHGRTYGALAVTRGYQTGFGPMLEGFRELPWDDVAAAEAAIGPQTAGVIVEPVQGEGGVRVASRAFLQKLRELCTRHGACLVFDEVQCGLGRVGSMFAFQQFDVEPDVVTLGKALGAGLPMGAILAREPWGEALRRSDHASTFGGNPVAAAAATAGLRVLREEGLDRRSLELGERLRQMLRATLAGAPLVQEVRGLGLMIGIELTAGQPLGTQIVDACREHGLLLNCTADRVLRVMPPLTVTERELEQGVGVLGEVLREMAARGAAAAG